MEILRRWQPTARSPLAARPLDKVTVQADHGSGSAWPSTPCWRTRSGTPPSGDVIKLSVVGGGIWGSGFGLIVREHRPGHPPAELLRHVFDRFRSGDSGPSGAPASGWRWSTAVARAHGGDVTAQSTPSRAAFELLLPAQAGPLELMPGPTPGTPAEAGAANGRLARLQVLTARPAGRDTEQGQGPQRRR